MITFLKDLSEGDLAGKKVLVRVDFNVPVKDGVVVDDYRIIRALPTIEYLRKNKAKIILISHIETKDVTPTLVPVFEYLKQLFPITFVEDCFSEHASIAYSALQEGGIILCENIRRYEGEKNNDSDFAKHLASLADIYVNDAFAVSHRKHASVVGIPKFLPSYAGLLLSDEITNLKIDEKTPHPFMFILGGAKFDTKLPLIETFLKKADKVFVGGALVNDVLKAKGYEVGKSLVSEIPIDISHIISDRKLILPVDVVCQDGKNVETKSVTNVGIDDVIVDVGQKTIESLADDIKNAKYILWNGPLGNFEIGFKQGTISLCKLIGESDAQSVVGGGDTLASIQELHLEDQFSFISTGGGAMLELLLEGTLPGVEALNK